MAPQESSHKIHLALDLDSYFQEQILSISQKQGLRISPFANQYLARILSKFSSSEKYLTRSQSEQKNEFPALAPLWLESLTQKPMDQYSQMQLLGDIALFTSGFFGDRIKGSVVDLDYYEAMGERAYETAGKLRESLGAERIINVFFELAGSFHSFVEVFAEISDQSLLVDDKALLKLYEKWLASPSQRIARMLGEQGVIASVSPKKDEN